MGKKQQYFQNITIFSNDGYIDSTSFEIEDVTPVKVVAVSAFFLANDNTDVKTSIIGILNLVFDGTARKNVRVPIKPCISEKEHKMTRVNIDVNNSNVLASVSTLGDLRVEKEGKIIITLTLEK